MQIPKTNKFYVTTLVADVAQLSLILGVAKRTIQKRAVVENWPYEEKKARGGTRRLYTVNNLPETAQSDIAKCLVAGVDDGSAAEKIISIEQRVKSEKDRNYIREIIDGNFTKDTVRVSLVILADFYHKKRNIGKVKGFDEFCKRYNQRGIDVNPQLYSIIKTASRISLLRWQKNYQIPVKIPNTAIEALRKDFWGQSQLN